MTAPRLLDHLAAIADDYDLYLLDQWGVLHDGENAHPGAAHAMKELKARGKTIILVSNSSKQVDVTVERLTRLGFTEAHYDHVLTSGSLAAAAMDTKSDPFYAEVGAKCVVITKENNLAFLEGRALEPVADLAAADFVLVADIPHGPIDDIVPLLQKAIARDLPMVVLNPDFVSIAPDGAMHSCPGKVGRAYEELGGTVKIHGKPSPGVYAECFRLAPGAKTALAIGDSLYHDIAGADGAGIDSVFVTSGIHAYDLGAAPGADADPAKVAALCVEYEVRPKYFATRMIW